MSVSRTPPLAHLLCALALLPPAAASAHGGAPQVKEIRFPTAAAGRAWLVDEIGLLAEGDAGFEWLCDESVSTIVGFDSLAPVDAAGDVWAVSTQAGVFRTEDRGCSFARVEGPLTEHVTTALLQHPLIPEELLTATATLGIVNDVYRSTDGGRTWTAAGLASQSRVRSLFRAPGDPRVIYASHGAGVSRSDDGGQSFVPITLGPPALPSGEEARPEEFRFIGGHPGDALDVFGFIDQFPESYLVHSRDGGLSWDLALAIEDSADSMVVSADGARMLISTPFSGLRRSEDGGEQWSALPTPGIIGCLTMAPGAERVWGCGRGQPKPWVVATSDDFGASWSPLMTTYSEIAAGWSCPAGSPTASACRSICDPGDPSCAGGDAGPDGGGVDGGDVSDAGADAAEPPAGGGDGGDDGCRAAPGAPTALGVCLLIGLRRRRS